MPHQALSSNSSIEFTSAFAPFKLFSRVLGVRKKQLVDSKRICVCVRGARARARARVQRAHDFLPADAFRFCASFY